MEKEILDIIFDKFLKIIFALENIDTITTNGNPIVRKLLHSQTLRVQGI